MPHTFRRSERLALQRREFGFTGRQWSRTARRRLRQRIVAELSGSHRNWFGHEYPEMMVRISRHRYYPDQLEKYTIQLLGDSFGCHTCRTHISNDRNQPWTGDHLPPSELRDALRQDVEGKLKLRRGQQVLAPQCSGCSSKQAVLVKKLNSMTTTQARTYLSLNPGEKELIQGKVAFRVGDNCIWATGPQVNQTQGRQVQYLGERNGCHSCGTLYPASKYIADHVVPKEFCTNYMPRVFKKLGIDDIDWNALELRPQCPRCSTRQGGNLSTIRKQAVEFARSVGITVYKY